MRRQWFVDGLALDDSSGRWNVLLDSPPAQASKRRVGSLELPGRSGSITKRQGWGNALQRFRFVLRGPDVETNVDVLVSALARAETLVAQVGDRMREARVIDVTLSEPERVFIDYWRLECSLSLQPFWVEVPGVVRPVWMVSEDFFFGQDGGL